jgi:hypothetical protein
MTRALWSVALSLVLILGITGYLCVTYHAGELLDDRLAVLAHAR